MNIILVILLAVTGIVAPLLIIALLMRREHYVRREIIIDAPRQKVFDYIRLLRNQDEFNRHAMTDADRKKEFKGTDGTVGYIYKWSGDKSAGEGEKEIMNIVEGKKIEAEIRFTKPMTVSARVIMEAEPLSESQTKVCWSNGGKLGYPFNIMIPMMERSVAKEMDASLLNLKGILEK